jgi:histidine ammonia-lyase
LRVSSSVAKAQFDMQRSIVLEGPLDWRQLSDVASGMQLVLSDTVRTNINAARRLVDAIVDREIRGYGINTGVGALSDVIIDRAQQRSLSRNIVMSHACGIGRTLGELETRAILAAQIANFAHGRSGVRLEVVDALLALLNANILPRIPERGSVGYLTHAAAIGLVLIGEGSAIDRGTQIDGREALARIGLPPFLLEAKEGLSLVNGTPCATGLACAALARFERLLDWADVAAAMSFENLGTQPDVFAVETLSLRTSPGLAAVGKTLRCLLEGSGLLANSAGRRTQDPLSLRAVPQVHGAVRDGLPYIAETVDRELSSVTDNPAVGGTLVHPSVHSQANAVGAALALAMDSLAISAAQLAAISERRLDRLVNPLVSSLPAFLAGQSGVQSGFMIAQYTAASLVAENRRLASPASLDGGITSALQEDMLTHHTAAAAKAVTIIDNLEQILVIELLASAQAYDCQSNDRARAPGTEKYYSAIRKLVPRYEDDRPMNDDFVRLRPLLDKSPKPLDPGTRFLES